MHPQPRMQCKKAYELVTTGSPETSGLPCAMVLRLLRALPGAPGFLATIACASVNADLTPASGCQNHTTLPSASSALVRDTVSVHRIPPRVRDDHDTPLLVGRDET